MKKGFILFGGENNKVRNTYLFDVGKKEICKCNIYTGDSDRFLTNFIFQDGPDFLAFGETRFHIFSSTHQKFTGAQCYDFEFYSQKEPSPATQIENPEENQEGMLQAGNIDDLLI